ncbi:MAG: 2-phosphosulfolactate phosphatase [Burkholderiales bacterium]|nr:2-phosphosulfolactate phosphatase [Burkholderiales bacterium]
MKVEVVQFNRNLSPDIVKGKIAIVIDVFRATSVIVTALAHSAKEIIPTSTIDEALEIFNGLETKNCLLGGERDMFQIDGFHMDNSPLSYMKNIEEKTIIFTTSNGTPAIHFCKQATKIFLASFLNAIYVVTALLKQKNDVIIVCAGMGEKYSLEDACCAGKLLSCLSKHNDIKFNDFEWSLKNMYEQNKDNLSEFLSNGSAFSKLFKGGFEADLQFCLQENIYPFVPEYNDGKILTAIRK